MRGTLKGEPALRLGLLAEANGGVLYVDEVNLLPDHLADALLDAAATGVSTVEREGFSAVQEARFVLMGSMNPEEGSLRPQLLDRFALVADSRLPLDCLPKDGKLWNGECLMTPVPHFCPMDGAAGISSGAETSCKGDASICACSSAMLEHISTIVCDHGVMSIRADLAIARASCAQAACWVVKRSRRNICGGFAVGVRSSHNAFTSATAFTGLRRPNWRENSAIPPPQSLG